MTLGSAVATGSALAFVLGLLVLLAALARRYAPRGGSAPGPGRVEILSRVGLAPRQGVATVRAGGRTALVSYGEGGIRLLFELDAERADAEALTGIDDAQGEDGEPPHIDDVGFRAALARAGKKVPALRALMLGLALILAVPAPSMAAAVPATAAAVAQEAKGATGVAQAAQLAEVRVAVGAGEENALELSGPVGTVLFVGFLTLLPTLLLLMTSFTRILIVLHLLKQALGTQTAPPAHLLAAMALILTGFVMAPTLEEANDRAVAPWMQGEMDTGEMLGEAAVPFRAFMLQSTREQDLAQYVQMSAGPAPSTIDEVPLVTLTAAFVTSELTSAFQMGFALFLPFVVIDVVVASVLMSMGMFMLPPVMVSLPFKLLLFVLVDGWSLVLGSLVQSF